jgi:hypothetical protein
MPSVMGNSKQAFRIAVIMATKVLIDMSYRNSGRGWLLKVAKMTKSPPNASPDIAQLITSYIQYLFAKFCHAR